MWQDDGDVIRDQSLQRQKKTGLIHFFFLYFCININDHKSCKKTKEKEFSDDD